MNNVLVLYDSRYGSVKQMARLIARGVESVKDVEAIIRTVPPVSPETEATKPAIPEEGDIYVTLDDLKNCGALAMGSPTRFGNMSASMKYFLETTTKLWFTGDLVNKPAGVFTSTSSMHGGQESTLLSMMLPLMHLGFFIVGVPFIEQALTNTVTGGTPYGPSHVAGAKSDHPISEDEKAICIAFGKRLAELSVKLG